MKIKKYFDAMASIIIIFLLVSIEAPFWKMITISTLLGVSIGRTILAPSPWNLSSEAPKSSGRYLVMIEELTDLGISHWTDVIYYNSSKGEWSNHDLGRITHWMELPNKPIKL